MSLSDRIQAAERNLERLLEWVNRFDSKSSLVLGIDASMLGVVSGLAPPFRMWTGLAVTLAGLTITLLAVGLGFVFAGVFPRTKGPKSLLYFGSVGKMPFSDYRQMFLEQTDRSYLNDLLEQCHRNSEILNHKFGALQWSYRAVLFAVIPWGATIFLFRSLV